MQNIMVNIKESHEICSQLISKGLHANVELTSNLEAELHVYSSFASLQKARVIVYENCIEETILSINADVNRYLLPDYYILINRLKEDDGCIIVKNEDIEMIQKLKNQPKNDCKVMARIRLEYIALSEIQKLFFAENSYLASRLIG
jgi:hypothetical protein